MATDPQASGMEEVRGTEFASLNVNEEDSTRGARYARDNLEVIYEVPVKVSAELGQTLITIRQLLTLGPGSVIELERLAGESVDLMVNGVLIGKGDVVVVNENFGLRITEVVCLEERLKKISGN